MKSYLPILSLCLGILTLSSCQKKETAELPYLGHNEIVGQDTVKHTVGDFRFLDQDSTWVTNNTFKNKIYVADFFFTSCPTICPVMHAQMLRLYDTYEDDPEIMFLSHTIDPEHDTVAVLHDYADRLGVKSNKWHFVTGDKEDIYKLGQTSYIVTADEDASQPGGYIHSGAFLLVDKDRHIRGAYDGTKPEQVDRLMKDIETLKKEYSK